MWRGKFPRAEPFVVLHSWLITCLCHTQHTLSTSYYCKSKISNLQIKIFYLTTSKLVRLAHVLLTAISFVILSNSSFTAKLLTGLTSGNRDIIFRRRSSQNCQFLRATIRNAPFFSVHTMSPLLATMSRAYYRMRESWGAYVQALEKSSQTLWLLET